MRFRISLLLLWTIVGGCALAAQAQNPAALPPLPLNVDTVIKADVVTGFNSADSQVGDQVSLTTTEEIKQGKFKLPKGSMLVGHVTQVTTAPDSSQPGSVAILFDTASTPKGDRYAVRAGIASVTAKSSSSGFSRGGGNGGGYGRRRGMGGMGGMGGPAPSQGGGQGPTPVSSGTVSTRVPANAATVGSVVTSERGDFWVNPKQHVTVQIIAVPSTSAAAK